MGFNDAVKLACLFRMYADNQNQELVWQYALQIVMQLDALWSGALPMLAPIDADFPDAPFKTLCGILASLPYLGNGGQPGYTYSGPWKCHPDRMERTPNITSFCANRARSAT